MLLVKTQVRPSDIDGIGLFADEFIPKDTIIYTVDELFVKRLTQTQYLALPPLQKRFVDTYAYHVDEVYHISLDNDRFMNHSDYPNTYETKYETIARENIEMGDEITCNYMEICSHGTNFL